MTEPPEAIDTRPDDGDPGIGEVLAADRERTRAQIASLERNHAAIVDGARLTATDDEHDPEGATIAFERSQASALLASATAHLAEVEAALERIAEGTYGRCEECGAAMADARLRARPTARTCVGCA